MKLLCISTKNYRTLEDIIIPFENSYCTISGRNNSGKSCIIRLLQNLFGVRNERPWARDEYLVDYAEDKTQWIKKDEPIDITYVLELSQMEDPALITFISKINEKIDNDPVRITINYSFRTGDNTFIKINIDDKDIVEEQTSLEIANKIRDAGLLFLYSSTMPHYDVYYGRRGRHMAFYDLALSEDEKKHLKDAAKKTESSLRRLAKQNREELNTILGRLSEKYDVEFAPMDAFTTRHAPFGINLKDKSVEVPLNEWGSGTQNRTRILMAVLQANRIRTTESSQNKITPIVVVEEPESFLHPSAQSEFGRVLRTIAKDLGIQLIVTTHSPYMLNQEDPGANILLCRSVSRGKALKTEIASTSGDNWMAPFAEHLGVPSHEFSNWLPLFSSYESKVLLVEGETDQAYLEFLQKTDIGIEKLRADIEVVPYGGKDTLKNTMLVKFVLSKFDNVFLTYDLDCKDEISDSLKRLGLTEKKDHLPLGINKPGRNAIEGLLPDSVLSKVNGKETDLVMELQSQNGKERRKAKEALKKKYLNEFKSREKFTKEELALLETVTKQINQRFSKPHHTAQCRTDITPC